MDPAEIVVLSTALLLFALVSARAQAGVVTPPMVFAALGLVIEADGLDLVGLSVEGGFIRALAEITPALTLLTDASRIDVTALDRRHAIPIRLLAVGLPLCMVAGTGAAWRLFPALGLWDAAALAVTLAPTDAALGQAVVSNRSVQQSPDQSLYPANSGSELCHYFNRALQRADQIERSKGASSVEDWFAPIVADAEVGFGGPLNAFELMKAYIEAGAAGVHFEDQLASEKRCGHPGGKVLVPTSQHIRTLTAARLAAAVMGTPTLVICRTGAEAAKLMTSDIDGWEEPFVDAEFASEADGYAATRHQREVGTGYVDAVSQAISGGRSSTTAMGGSTEAAQFKAKRAVMEAAE